MGRFMHCTSVHIAHQYTLHISTHSTSVQIAHQYTLHISTHCTSVHIAHQYTLHISTHSTSIHIAYQYTLHISTHLLRLTTIVRWKIKIEMFLTLAENQRPNIRLTFNWINQPNAANSQVYYLSFKYSSTCFGHPHAHHQELQELQ